MFNDTYTTVLLTISWWLVCRRMLEIIIDLRRKNGIALTTCGIKTQNLIYNFFKEKHMVPKQL